MRYLLIITILLMPVCGYASGVAVDVETGITGFGGYNNVDIPKDTGTRFSLTDDLSLESKAFVRVRLTKEFKKNNFISVLYAPLSLKAGGVLPADVSFNGDLFPANTEVDGTYRFDSYRITYYKKYEKSEKLDLKIGFTAKIRDASIKIASASKTSEKKNTGFVPLLNFGAEYEIAPKFSIVFDADALAGGPGRAEDVLLAGSYKTSDSLKIKLGYRIVEGGADVTEVYNFALLNYFIIGFTYKM
ncbi:MAG: hypothetical protein JW871_03365 [Endomicrobiales bacterium]|nr:hypothetical protein [Endomicrobiales bacterium]